MGAQCSMRTPPSMEPNIKLDQMPLNAFDTLNCFEASVFGPFHGGVLAEPP
jgi:hypothetical protein